MKLIVNTNRIIAALIKDSSARQIITHLNAELFVIPYSEKEIEKYKHEILEKAKVREQDLDLILNKLNEKLISLNDGIINSKMNEAKDIMDRIDPKDAPFIAAALALGADIWSEDKHFGKQNKIKVWKTEALKRFL